MRERQEAGNRGKGSGGKMDGGAETGNWVGD